MTEGLEALAPKQARKVIANLGTLSDYDHIQSRRSDVDGAVTVEAFGPGRKVRTIVTGPRGGIKSDEISQVR